MMKPGMKLKSTVCETEVMVIRGSQGAVECGGAAMADAAPAEKGLPAADFTGGTQMGKRYIDAAGTVELLCVRPGKGSLALNGVALAFKDTKSLPSSD